MRGKERKMEREKLVERLEKGDVEAKRELKAWLEEKVKGEIEAAKCEWMRCDDVPRTEIWKRLKARREAGKIEELTGINGESVKGKEAVLEEIRRFYEKLYEEEVAVKGDWNEVKKKKRRLSEKEKGKMEKPLKLKHFWEATRKMSKGKTP